MKREAVGMPVRLIRHDGFHKHMFVPERHAVLYVPRLNRLSVNELWDIKPIVTERFRFTRIDDEGVGIYEQEGDSW